MPSNEIFGTIDVTVADLEPYQVVHVGGQTISFYTGVGSPESVVTGAVGDRYADISTGDEWQKASGTGTTGWVLLGSLAVDDFTPSLGPEIVTGFVYVGGLDANSDWRISRFEISNSYDKTSTTTGAADLASAWAIKETLTYA